MRRKRSRKVTLAFVGMVALSVVLAILAVTFLPIPSEWKRLVFLLLIPLLSFIGVFITGKMARR